MSYLGNVGLSNKTDGLYLGLVNLSLNTSANQLLYSPNGYDISGLNVSDGLNISGTNLSTVGNPNIQLVSNSLFANDNLVSIQSQVNLANQADVVYISSGSYTENLTINNKYNISLNAPEGSITEILGNFNISGNSELIRLNNIQLQGLQTNYSGVGRYILNRINHQGQSGLLNVVEIKDCTKYITFENCDWDQYCTLRVTSTFYSVVYFINCNFGGCSITLQNAISNQQVIFSNCAGFTSFPTSTKCTFIGMNVLTSGESINTATTVKATTIDNSYFIIDGNSTSGSTNKVITTDGENGLKLTSIGGPSSFYNVMYENGQQTDASGSSIILFTKTNQGNIIPDLRALVQFIANFTLSGDNTDIITFEFIDDQTSTVLSTMRQTIAANGSANNRHFNIAVNFDFVMSANFTMNFSVKATALNHTLSVDEDDFYSIIFNEVQPA